MRDASWSNDGGGGDAGQVCHSRHVVFAEKSVKCRPGERKGIVPEATVMGWTEEKGEEGGW